MYGRRLRRDRRQGFVLCALGDGAQARCERSRSPKPMCPSSRRRRSRQMSVAIGIDFADFDSLHRAVRFCGTIIGRRENRSCRRHHVEESEHMMATRLYQNTARVHFNLYAEGKGRFGRRLIYGGHVISLARALSFNGLGNAVADCGDQWRTPRQSAVRRRHRVRVVRSARQKENIARRIGDLARCGFASSQPRTCLAGISRTRTPTGNIRKCHSRFRLLGVLPRRV